MEYLKTISIPAHNVVLYGKAVGEMVERGMRVRQDGTVKGKFHHVTGYRGFNSANPAEQEGCYFPFLLNETGEKMDFIKNGKPRKTGLDFEPYNVFRVTAEDTFEVKVDGKTVAKFDFSQATFEEKKGERKMKVDFFDPGVCGLMVTGHIGTLTKDTKGATEGVVFENALPVGTRMVYLAAICSDDLEGGTSVTAGDGTTEDIYAKEHAIEKGKGGAAHPDLPLITSGTVKVKLGAEITKGTVDIYATVIRLEV